MLANPATAETIRPGMVVQNWTSAFHASSTQPLKVFHTPSIQDMMSDPSGARASSSLPGIEVKKFTTSPQMVLASSSTWCQCVARNRGMPTTGTKAISTGG